ncbi:MAG: hypothetical protein K2N28_10030 [Muribaculaceae bacterium]|nr:hypothetical protein [Muribaculaceae bacterium]
MKNLIILLIMTTATIVSCSSQSGSNVQAKELDGDITEIQDSCINQPSDLTLKDFLNINSNKEISKVIFYTLDQLFCNQYDGNNVYDDFTNLLRGDTINMARHAYRIFTTQAGIDSITDMIYHLPYIGESKYRYPELEFTVSLVGRRELLLMKKVSPDAPKAVFIISLADNSRLVIWQYRDVMNYTGHLFRFDYLQEPPSDYDILYEDIYNTKTHDYLKYFD